MADHLFETNRVIWTPERLSSIDKVRVSSVYMIRCRDTGSIGTGFLLKNSCIVTSRHVIDGKLRKVTALSVERHEVTFTDEYSNPDIDLVLLKPYKKLVGGLTLDTTETLAIGDSVCTWGFPISYEGPSPILSKGYLAGVKEIQIGTSKLKYLVVNGAFNNGNSGGPLFAKNSIKPVGIVVTKCLPLTNSQKKAIQIMQENKEVGIKYSYTQDGKQISFHESQVVADILKHYQKLMQLMIGEAICASEIEILIKNTPKNFLY